MNTDTETDTKPLLTFRVMSTVNGVAQQSVAMPTIQGKDLMDAQHEVWLVMGEGYWVTADGVKEYLQSIPSFTSFK
jgi:hypothetical protein